MIESCLGIINFEDIGSNFGELCRTRPAYMLPIGGRYRLVDFALSNMVNHGIKTVALYTGEKVRSTMDHIGDGKPWELNRRLSGLLIFPPQFDDNKKRMGDIYQYHMTAEYFLNTKEDYVFMINSNILSKVDLSSAFDHFIKTDSDITILYKEQNNDKDEYINNDKLIIDKEGRLINIGVNLGANKTFNQFMFMGFMKKTVFLEIVKDAMETGEDYYFKQAMMKFNHRYKVNTYEFKGHVDNIKDVQSYYNANMNLLDNKIFKELFFEGGTILTKAKDEPPTLYAESSNVNNSLIANGCIIEGYVENSILFRGVKVGKNAIVKNSILMQKCNIHEDAILVNSILDKYVTLEKGARIAGSKSNPHTIGKNSVIAKE